MTALFWLVSRLPISWAQAFGALVGSLIARLPGRYGQRLRGNYRNAFPDSTERDINQASRSAGRMMMEMPYFWMRKNALTPLRIEPETFYDPVGELLGKGKGVILLSPHLGGYELLGPLFAQHCRSTVLFKPPKNAYLKTWVEKMRAGPELKMAPANFKGVRMLLKALRKGEIIGILPDQCPPGGEGEWASFFGRPAYTMTLVQKLQVQTGASIVFVCAQRLTKGGTFRIHVEPLADVLPSCPRMATLMLNQHLERLIRLAPDQYLWGYNRYRRPSGAVAAPAG
jgi:KDO2-lipid IV(A) lauroyltransferase